MKLEIETVCAGEAESFARSETDNAAADGSLIIYPTRARALAHNPDARHDDPVLLLARQSDQYIGYIAAMWDRLEYRSTTYRWVWGVQFYVVPQHRSPRCAFMLIQKMNELADGWGAWNIAAGAARVCKALGAWEPAALRRLETVTRRNGVGRLLGSWFRPSTRPSDDRAKRLLDDLKVRYEPTTRLEDALTPSRPANGSARFARSTERFDWYLRFPWLTRQGEDPGGPWMRRPHPWSRSRPRHDLELLQLSTSGRPDGYVLLCHTQVRADQPSRTCLLDWHRTAGRGFDVAVAAAVDRQTAMGTETVQVSVAECHGDRVTAPDGLQVTPHAPVFLASCRRESPLIAAGLKDLAPGEWDLGGAEGDQVPLMS